MFIKRTAGCCLDCRQIHSVSRARPNQARSPHVHLPDGGGHLLDRVDFLDHETVRQKSLIDQLHNLLICRVEPDRPKMLSAYLHVSFSSCSYDVKTLTGAHRGNREIIKMTSLLLRRVPPPPRLRRDK